MSFTHFHVGFGWLLTNDQTTKFCWLPRRITRKGYQPMYRWGYISFWRSGMR